MARDCDRIVDALRRRLAACATLEVSTAASAPTQHVLAPGRGRRVIVGVWDNSPRTLVLTFPDKVCTAIAQGISSIDPLDAGEVQLNNLILGFCKEVLSGVFANAAQSMAPPAICRSAVALGTSPDAAADSQLLQTTRGDIGITSIAERRPAPSSVRPPRQGMPRVLIVDDDPLARKLLAKAVSDLDVEFTTVESGDQAIAAAVEMSPDMILLDFDMPGMNGHECLLRLRQNLPDAHVVMVTARGTADVVRKCVEAGAAGFIVKPFRIADLQRRIRRSLELAEPARV